MFLFGGAGFLAGLLVVFGVVVAGLRVVVVFFTDEDDPAAAAAACCWSGMTSSGGVLPSKIPLATQHLRSDLQRPPTSRMASQKPERRSATHTPGQDSGRRGDG